MLSQEEMEAWIDSKQNCTPIDLYNTIKAFSIHDLLDYASYLNMRPYSEIEDHRFLAEKLYIHLIKEGIVKCNF